MSVRCIHTYLYTYIYIAYILPCISASLLAPGVRGPEAIYKILEAIYKSWKLYIDFGSYI